jgi:hypothetical protein
VTIEDALRKHEERLRRLPNVTSVGVGEDQGEQVILVFVDKKVPESELRPEEVVPTELDGYRTAVRTRISVYTA